VARLLCHLLLHRLGLLRQLHLLQVVRVGGRRRVEEERKVGVIALPFPDQRLEGSTVAHLELRHCTRTHKWSVREHKCRPTRRQHALGGAGDVRGSMGWRRTLVHRRHNVGREVSSRTHFAVRRARAPSRVAEAARDRLAKGVLTLAKVRRVEEHEAAKPTKLKNQAVI